VLSITTVALLNGLDGAQGTGAKNKARSVAAALAEQDLERMRAMPAAGLAGYTQTRPVTVRNVTYTVKSTATWAVDDGGPISCSNNSRTAANIRIVSEVTSPATRGVVDAASLVTPPPGTYAAGQGRAIVKVFDRDQAPVQGITVTMTGPGSFSETTNALGCAVFPFVPIGTYTAAVSGLGYVNWDGSSPATKPLVVTQSASTAETFEMDAAAEIRAQFDTVVGGVTVPAEARWLRVSNSKMTVSPKLFTAPTSTPPFDTESQVNATSLFPFVDGYTVYPGQCTANAAGAKSYAPTPGQIFIMSTNKLRLPSINIRVVANSSTTSTTAVGQNGVTVMARSADTCTANSFPLQTSAAVTYGSTTYQGALPKPGFPYGTYKLCAQRTVGTTTTHGHADVQPWNSTASTHTDDTVTNTNAAGTPVAWNTANNIRIWLKDAGPCHGYTANGFP
jgi:hypothetical protein